ncbi:sulfur carrier protein ThiS [Aquimarina sp. MMG015]|uniref:sulfur carrier protein ThiS n=1 Tax=Aquimarina TaxID=290174 RepID=UPI0003FD0DF8|nr:MULTISPECIES: sulfur carrier protein ThiS [Aquimarina]AXT56986.1 sulfur carrier protein ThiS [Aquimarina sp. AD1]MBQ4801769.1 sulfur carrier protein ThiS [Aquimarina sp. MMG015]RKN36942.1 sulfur carrier protein ThiS [Aquimarina sp. AD1]
MTINVNNQKQIISENSSIDFLLEELSLSKNGIAIAINNQIITKDTWSDTIVKVNDNVTIIRATQGG